MRVIVQRVKQASVSVAGTVVGKCGNGFLLLVGFSNSDTGGEITPLINKILNIRIFDDENGKMNLSIQDVKGSILSISQFTLYANCKNGRRPSFTEACKYEVAERYYATFVNELLKSGLKVGNGVFGAMMEIEADLVGPTTITLDSSEII